MWAQTSAAGLDSCRLQPEPAAGTYDLPTDLDLLTTLSQLQGQGLAPALSGDGASLYDTGGSQGHQGPSAYELTSTSPNLFKGLQGGQGQQLLPQLTKDSLFAEDHSAVRVDSTQAWDAWGLPGWYSAPGVLVQAADSNSRQHPSQQAHQLQQSLNANDLLLLQQLEQQQQQQQEAMLPVVTQDQGDQLLELQRQLQQLQALQQAQQQQQQQVQQPMQQLLLQDDNSQQQQQDLIVKLSAAGPLRSDGHDNLQRLLQLQQAQTSPTQQQQLQQVWLQQQQQQQQQPQQQLPAQLQLQLQQSGGLLPSAALANTSHQAMGHQSSRSQVQRLLATISLNRSVRGVSSPSGQAGAGLTFGNNNNSSNAAALGQRVMSSMVPPSQQLAQQHQQQQQHPQQVQIANLVLPNGTKIVTPSGTTLITGPAGATATSANGGALYSSGGSQTGVQPNIMNLPQGLATLGSQGQQQGLMVSANGTVTNLAGLNLTPASLAAAGLTVQSSQQPPLQQQQQGLAQQQGADGPQGRVMRSSLPLGRLPAQSSSGQAQHFSAHMSGVGSGGMPQTGVRSAGLMRQPLNSGAGPGPNRYLHTTVRAQPPSWAGADWNPRAGVSQQTVATGTGVFLPHFQRSASSASTSQSAASTTSAATSAGPAAAPAAAPQGAMGAPAAATSQPPGATAGAPLAPAGEAGSSPAVAD